MEVPLRRTAPSAKMTRAPEDPRLTPERAATSIASGPTTSSASPYTIVGTDKQPARFPLDVKLERALAQDKSAAVRLALAAGRRGQQIDGKTLALLRADENAKVREASNRISAQR